MTDSIEEEPRNGRAEKRKPTTSLLFISQRALSGVNLE